MLLKTYHFHIHPSDDTSYYSNIKIRNFSLYICKDGLISILQNKFDILPRKMNRFTIKIYNTYSPKRFKIEEWTNPFGQKHHDYTIVNGQKIYLDFTLSDIIKRLFKKHKTLWVEFIFPK